jgi:hypothetical protein
MTTTTTDLRKGDQFYSHTMQAAFRVTRVSRAAKWADIVVRQDRTGVTWSKRQPLVDGRFAFQAEQL